MDHSTALWLAGQIPPFAVVWATFLGLIPTIAAFVAVIWYLILIWESKTVQEWRSQHHLRRLTKIEAERAILIRLLKEEHTETPENMAEGPVEVVPAPGERKE